MNYTYVLFKWLKFKHLMMNGNVTEKYMNFYLHNMANMSTKQ